MTKKGFTLIELLIVVAIIAILAAIAVPNFLDARTRASVARVQSDMRSMATAIGQFQIDNGAYPDAATGNGTAVNAYGHNADRTFRTTGSGNNQAMLIFQSPTFRIWHNNAARDGNPNANPPVMPVKLITTPNAYMTTLPADPFADLKGVTYRYAQSNPIATLGGGYILWSFGPDMDEEEDMLSNNKSKESDPTVPSGMNAADYKNPYKTQSGTTLIKMGGDIPVGRTPAGDADYPNVPYVPENVYNPSGQVPSKVMQYWMTYDPSNGTASDGDIYRLAS